MTPSSSAGSLFGIGNPQDDTVAAVVSRVQGEMAALAHKDGTGREEVVWAASRALDHQEVGEIQQQLAESGVKVRFCVSASRIIVTLRPGTTHSVLATRFSDAVNQHTPVAVQPHLERLMDPCALVLLYTRPVPEPSADVPMTQGGRQPDYAWAPDPMLSNCPSVVVEIGVSQTTGSLETKARHWIENQATAGRVSEQVRLVILVDLVADWQGTIQVTVSQWVSQAVIGVSGNAVVRAYRLPSTVTWTVGQLAASRDLVLDVERFIDPSQSAVAAQFPYITIPAADLASIFERAARLYVQFR